MKYPKVRITIFAGLILFFASIHGVWAGGDERKLDKVYFSFEKEQEIWGKWHEENMNMYILEPLYYVGDEEYYHEVERRLATYYQDADFFVIYYARNIDNGILQTTLFIQDSNTWNQIDWVENSNREIKKGRPLALETRREIADFDRKTCERSMKIRRFYFGTENYFLMDGTSIYIYVFDGNKIGRFAFYGNYGVNPNKPTYNLVKQLLSEVVK